MEPLEELRERLIAANRTLGEMAWEYEQALARQISYDNREVYSRRHRHLTSKGEGVRLALSFVDELIGRNNAEVQDPQ